MVKNVCSERKTIIPKPIIRLTSFDLIQTTIFLPRAKDYLTTIVRSWHTCNQRSATLRQISYRSALPFTRGCGRITGRSEVGDPDFEISWTWRETMVSVWTVCRTEMGVKVTSGVNSFLWSEYQRMRDLVYECVSGQADTRRLTRTTIRFFSLSFFSFFKVTPLVQSRNSIGNFLSPASLSPISVTPPHILPPSTPRIRSNYVGRKYVRSKSLFPAFGRLPRICSLTVHLDKMPPFCHRNETERERDMHFA